MHRRGTHCGRSDRKTQISRAQSRRNSGIAEDKSGEILAAVAFAVAGTGSNQATDGGSTAAKSRLDRAEAGAAGNGTDWDSDSATQQQMFLATQQGQGSTAGGGVAKSVWADAIS